jgi:uncharacterized protein (TIGR02266 family)
MLSDPGRRAGKPLEHRGTIPLVPSPTFSLALVWDGTASAPDIQRVFENLETCFEPSVVSNLALIQSPAFACLHFTVDFSAYSRSTLSQLESETKKSGGRFIELLRIPEDKREAFKTQFLMPAHGTNLSCSSFKDCSRPLVEHLAKLASGRADVPTVKPPPQPRQSSSETRQAPRFNVNLDVEFKTEFDFTREHASNISKGGVFVRTTQRPALNSELGLRIKLPNGQVIQTSARVVHVVDHPQHGGVGLAFSREDPLFSGALDRYLAEIQKK